MRVVPIDADCSCNGEHNPQHHGSTRSSADNSCSAVLEDENCDISKEEEEDKEETKARPKDEVDLLHLGMWTGSETDLKARAGSLAASEKLDTGILD